MSKESDRIAAFAMAACDVMAVVYAEMEIMRSLLDEHGSVSRTEFDAAVASFPAERLDAIAKDLKRKTMAKANQILEARSNPSGIAH